MRVSADADADLPTHARRRRDVAIPWGDPGSEHDGEAPSEPAPRNGTAPRPNRHGDEGSLPEAQGQWFVEAPSAEVDPRLQPEPEVHLDGDVGIADAGIADLDEFEHFGEAPVGDYLDGALDEVPDETLGLGYSSLNADTQADGGHIDDGGYDDPVYVDEEHVDEEHVDSGYRDESYADVAYTDVAYTDVAQADLAYPDVVPVEATYQSVEPEPAVEPMPEVEGPPLTPLEERLARRAAKLSYRGSRVEAVYDVSGPKVRLGVLWFLLAWAGFALGTLGVGAVFVTAATVASLQVAAHLMIEEDTNSRVTAAVITAAVGTSAIFNARVVGVVILVAVAVAFVVASQTVDRNMTLHVAGLTLRASLPLGIAMAAILYLHRIDAWVFMILFGIVSIYDAGNFLVGTGSRRIWVGPLAGLMGAAAVVFGAAGFEAPPLTEKTTWLLGGLAALACPLGQIVGSFMLPRPDARAPALRRLDTYLVAGPLMLALFLAIGGNRPLM